jgi:hypothetical protein
MAFANRRASSPATREAPSISQCIGERFDKLTVFKLAGYTNICAGYTVDC